ncbi:Nuclear pore glycoprotein p62 [Bulinus truncatus]|nr:Nuclear pore glycoprotein p62 [Bulinus truncatus]
MVNEALIQNQPFAQNLQHLLYHILDVGTGFTFGAPGTSTDSSGGFSGFNFGATTTSGATGATSTGGYGGFSFSGSTPSSSAAPGFNFGAAKLVCQLEDTMNKWTAELEEQEKYFLEQATQVNAWDRVVMENGEKIVQLNKDVEKVKLNQQKLDHELDFVQSQEKELEDILVPLEKALDSMPPINYQQHADIEREHTYILAESLDAQLKRMGQDLTEIIERLNATKIYFQLFLRFRLHIKACSQSLI